MNMDAIPIGVLFAATVIVVVVTIQAGYSLGQAVLRRSEHEKEPPVSAIAAASLGLVGFMMVFTFGIVTDRFFSRIELVRAEANAIRTASMRSDFLPEPDRGRAGGLLRRYVDLRLDAVRAREPGAMNRILTESTRIQRQLWDMAVVNARKDMNSDVAALYIESLNGLIDIHALRVAVGLQMRIPGGIWLILYALVVLSMIAVGYQTAIAESTRKSWTMLILALSFALVISLIASLDRPQSGFITVSQQPLMDLRASMAAGLDDPLRPGDRP